MVLENPRFEKIHALAYHRFLGVFDWYSNAGEGKLSIIVNENSANPNGVLHGGVIHSLCDVCASMALLEILPENTDAVTHDIHVSILRPAPLNKKVTFHANIIKQGKRICFVDSKALIENKMIATACVTKSIIYAVS